MTNRALAPVMVGRQSQLAELLSALERSAAGAGQVVFIAGEAGVGKTRLIREFLRRAERRPGVSIAIGHCYDEGPAPPYSPFSDLLRGLSQAPLGADLRQLLPEAALPQAGESDPQAQRRLLFQSIHRALRPQPGETRLIVLEDLHWSDQASHELLHYLARAITDERAMILGTYRSDEMNRLHPLAALIARLTRDRRYHEIRLAPLSRRDLAELLAAALGAAPPHGLLDALYERTEGNPFFAEELLDALLERGVGAPGQASLDPGAVGLPISIKDSIMRRIAGLDEAAAAVLRDAAVIGRRFDFELLQRLTGLAEPALLRSLATLVERQLIVEQAEGLDEHYRFRHELIRAALYEEMLRRERRARHQEVLRALEQTHGDAPASAIDQLAYHALHARALPEAARYSELAGDRAAAIHAYREALGHYEVALEVGEHLPACDPLARASLLTRTGRTAYLTGDSARCGDYWAEALAIYRQQGERRRSAEIQLWLGRAAWDRGDATAAFAETRAALETLEGEPACHELAMAYSALSHLYMLSMFTTPGACGEAIAWGERALALAEELGDDQVRCHALNNIGVALYERGECERGTAMLERSLALARAADLPADIVRSYINLGSRISDAGNHQRALATLREGWAYAAAHGYLRGSSKLLFGLLNTEYDAGEWESLEAHIGEVLRPDYAGASDDRNTARRFLAMLLFRRNRPAEAQALIEQLIADGADDHECMVARQVLVRALHAQGRTTEAIAVADQLLANFQAAGALSESAGKLFALFTFYLSIGRRAEAEQIAAPLLAMVAGRDDMRARAIEADIRGNMALADEDYETAIRELERAARLCEQLSYPAELIRQQRILASALLARGGPGDREAALAALASARARAERIQAAHDLALIDALAQPDPPRPAPRSPEGLTPREMEVLALITRGYSNRAIAQALVISEKTAEVHVRNILGKLGFSSRTQAATYAVERGLVARSA